VAWRLRTTNGLSDFENHFGGVHWGNADHWDEAAADLGYVVDDMPAVGAVAQTDAGRVGHVAWVSAVGDGMEAEETHARLTAVEAGLARVIALRDEYPDHLPLLDQIRDELEHEVSHVAPRDIPVDEAQQEALDHRAIRAAVLAAERESVIQLRDDGVINDSTLRRIELELDLEAVRAGD